MTPLAEQAGGLGDDGVWHQPAHKTYGNADQVAASAELASLVRLSMLTDMGPARLRALLSTGDGRSVLRRLASSSGRAVDAVRTCRGVNDDLIARWAAELRNEPIEDAELLERHRQAGVEIEPPAQLLTEPTWRDDPEPPVLLFRQGASVPYGSRRVGVVGTRSCSSYGRTMAANLGAGLAEAGVTVVSGLALGIDGVAQRACVDAGGVTVGVIGSGFDNLFPSQHERLAADIAATGTMLSEYALGTPAQRWRFPARNRLIAALSEVVVVVETPATGGSLYTVESALERGRTVMAVPGPATVRTSEGTNQLLADGCPPARHAEDVLDYLGIEPRALGGQLTERGSAADDIQVSAEAQELLGELVGEAATLDELVAASGLTFETVVSELHALASAGLVRESGGWWERLR